MPLLDICQSVCDEVGLPRPSAIAASSEQLARQMYSLANAELQALSKNKEWPLLQKQYSFNTVGGTSQYALPADYRKLIGNTVYNMSAYYQLRGSITADEWERTKGLNLGSLSRAKIRIYGSPLMLNMVPTPTGVETVVFEYITKYFAVTEVGATILKYSNDTDTSVVNEELVRMGLKWRIKHAKGLEFGTDLQEYIEAVDADYAAALAAPDISVGRRTLRDAPELTEGYVRDNGFG